MKTKKCSKCKRTKKVSEFHKCLKNKDGLYGYCRLCRKVVDSTYYQTSNKKAVKKARLVRIAQTIDDYKHEQGCRYCDEDEPCCLDFHHHNDDKEFCVSQGAHSKSEQMVWTEIKKCKVICANCHRKLHKGLL